MDGNDLLSSKIPEKLHDENTTCDNNIPVRQSDFMVLHNASMYCYQKIKNGEWSSSESSLYLSMYGINSKLQSSILTNGENDFNLSQLLNISTHGNDEEIQELLKNKSLDPNMYGPPDMPPS